MSAHLPGTRPALVLIDLQRGIAALPLAHPAADVLAASARLARVFRDAAAPVVRVRVAFSPDGGDALTAPVDAPPPAVAPGPDFATLCDEIGDGPTDLHITKHGWDAFHGTELDLQLRRRGIDTIVYAGISTSVGVESTARHGRELGYAQVFVRDAMSDLVASAHERALSVIFPRIGRVTTTEAIVGAGAGVSPE
ncbi:isochorismatase family protein [Agromyces larvae]|uniref:Isochorismatase family protein n=1 Tax=Agromyces larvae TaxID=2929802 RepID=A0ABY4BZ99_9MICO|nr:isochorismatase family protein [Agromyces larvae]UOE44069.1 isochorismatase family protein [Agromyces larvae]